jgi:hypothetical protein
VTFHAFATVCDPAKEKSTAHPDMAAVPESVTVNASWKPPGQEPVSWYVTEQPPAPGVDVVLDGGVVGGVNDWEGGLDGRVDGVLDGGVLGAELELEELGPEPGDVV